MTLSRLQPDGSVLWSIDVPEQEGLAGRLRFLRQWRKESAPVLLHFENGQILQRLQVQVEEPGAAVE